MYSNCKYALLSLLSHIFTVQHYYLSPQSKFSILHHLLPLPTLFPNLFTNHENKDTKSIFPVIMIHYIYITITRLCYIIIVYSIPLNLAYRILWLSKATEVEMENKSVAATFLFEWVFYQEYIPWFRLHSNLCHCSISYWSNWYGDKIYLPSCNPNLFSVS